MMLTFNNLTVYNPNEKILGDISMSILPGGIFNFYGPNGIGKTSLFNAIAYTIADRRQILLNNSGLSVNDSTYIPVDIGGYLPLTVLQNLKIFAELNNNTLAIMPCIKVFELEEHLDQPLSSLSTGWQRRVMLATLLFTQTPIWIIDEPFGNLDASSIQRVYDVLLSRAANGGIILISNHNPLKFKDVTNINLERFKC